MEKFQKNDDLTDDLDVFRDYGFNIDELMSMINDESVEEDK